MPKESLEAYNECRKHGRDDDAPDTFGDSLYYGGNAEIALWQASETGNLTFGAAAGHPHPTMPAEPVKTRPSGPSIMQKVRDARHGDVNPVIRSKLESVGKSGG